MKIRYDQELVLRFFAIKNDIDNYKYPVTEFLTRYLEQMTVGTDFFDYAREREVFRNTFKFINENWGDNAFSGKTPSGTMKNEFVLYLFDGVAISLANVVESILNEEVDNNRIVSCIDAIKYGEEIQSYKTGSVNGVKTRIKLFTEGVEMAIDG